MTDVVQVEFIRAASFIIPSVLSAFAAWKSSQAAHRASEAATKAAGVEVKMDGLLDARVGAARDIGHLEGKAAGVEQEREAQQVEKDSARNRK
jgi:hypothetical protein